MADEVRDEAWLEGVFRAHHRAVLAYAARRVPDEADDVVAEVFAAAWRHRATVPAEALPWLYRTAAHHVLHRRRSTARRSRLVGRLGGLGGDDAPTSSLDPTDEVVDRLDAVARVTRVLDALPPRDAEILRLSAWEQLDVASIAYVLSISPSAVRVRLHRARRRAEHLLAVPDPEASARTAPTPVPEEIR
ncbi:MAG: sigma-70 family RNA polymerase sigma factor [Candidatus Nanopelagicales bacterium]